MPEEKVTRDGLYEMTVHALRTLSSKVIEEDEAKLAAAKTESIKTKDSVAVLAAVRASIAEGMALTLDPANPQFHDYGRGLVAGASLVLQKIAAWAAEEAVEAAARIEESQRASRLD